MPQSQATRRRLFLERTHGFDPWRLGVSGVKTRYFDDHLGFSSELVVDAESEEAMLELAEALADRLDLDDYQLLSWAERIARRRGQGRELHDDPRYRHELARLALNAADGTSYEDCDWQWFEPDEAVLRRGCVVIWAQGDQGQYKAATVEPSIAAAKARFRDWSAAASAAEERFIDEGARIRRGPLARPSGLAERALTG